MIADFRCKDTKALFDGGNPRRFSSFASVALRKLDMLDAAKCLEDLRIPPRTDWSNSRVIELVSTAYVSTPNGVSALSGKTARHTVLKLLIITRRIPCASAHIREKSCWKNS